MTRLRELLGAVEVQATASIAFLVAITWPLWTSGPPSRALIVAFVALALFTIFIAVTNVLGRERDPALGKESEDEEEDAP
jgi:hypothetical protein